MKNVPETVQNAKLFSHIPLDDLPELLTLLNAQLRRFSKDETIYNQGRLERMSGVVLKGTAELHFCDENFNLVNLIHLKEGELFGAAMLLAGQRSSPMELLALTDCEVLFLDFSKLIATDGTVTATLSPAAHQLTANLMREFAQRLQFLSARVRILSQRRLRDKVKVYLQGLPRTEDGVITLPMNRNQLADYLYVDRSALSRELSHMQDDGILEVRGRELHLLDLTFLLN
ncbi:MAG: Crp/Fnr family transcriptional regulator [Acutalibacteraceae bacterium]|nr:Crp/Fnr family transcriptional regulator [Acutalibacteraceae bacterium]